MLVASLPAVGGIFDTGSAPLRVIVLAVIVAAILATRLGPRGR
jgi:hypothetical protein